MGGCGGGGGGGGGGGETVVMVAVVCWSLQSRRSGVLRRGLEVSVQGPALALRRQGAGTRHVVPTLRRWGSIG